MTRFPAKLTIICQFALAFVLIPQSAEAQPPRVTLTDKEVNSILFVSVETNSGKKVTLYRLIKPTEELELTGSSLEVRLKHNEWMSGQENFYKRAQDIWSDAYSEQKVNKTDGLILETKSRSSRGEGPFFYMLNSDEDATEHTIYRARLVNSLGKYKDIYLGRANFPVRAPGVSHEKK